MEFGSMLAKRLYPHPDAETGPRPRQPATQPDLPGPAVCTLAEAVDQVLARVAGDTNATPRTRQLAADLRGERHARSLRRASDTSAQVVASEVDHIEARFTPYASDDSD